MSVSPPHKLVMKNEQDTISYSKSMHLQTEITSVICVPKSKVKSKGTSINLEKEKSIETIPQRHDAKGNIITKANKKKFHIHFKDEFKGQKLIEFIDIPLREGISFDEMSEDEPIQQKPISKNRKTVGCACIFF
jgi:hypothetical protein